MVKLYYKVLLLIITIVVIFGWGLPYLISADSTELVVAGLVLGIVTVHGVYKFGRNIVMDIVALIESSEQEKN